MNKKILFSCLAVLIYLSCSFPLFASGHLTILMYHRFDAETAISTPMDAFKRQILYLKKNDYNFQTLDQVLEHLEQGKPFPEKAVFITVDDGYRSTYTKAFPFLEKHGIPWVLYVYTQAIDEGYGSSLTWEMVEEMADSGVKIENHTFSHGKFIKVEDKNDTWIEKEIHAPARRLKEKTGQESRTVSIPYGMYDTELLGIIREKTDYPIAMASDPGVVEPTRKPFIINRFGINRSTSWTQFKKKLARLPLAVEQTRPVPGARLASTPDTILVKLARPEKVARGPINIFISEFGAQNWEWKNREQGELVVKPESTLTRPWNRLIITAYDQDKGKYRYYSQGLVFTGD